MKLTFFAFPLIWPLAFDWFSVTQLWIPWARLSYTQVVDGWGVSVHRELFIVLINMVVFWFYFIRNKTFKQNIAASLFLVFMLGLYVRGYTYIEPYGNDWTPIVIVQGNLPIGVIRSQKESWVAAKEVYLDNIRQLDFKPGTLLVLPEEGAIPGAVNIEAPDENPSFRDLMAVAHEKQIAIITGIIAYKILPTDGREVYNAQALIDPRQEDIQFYFKRELVPFGEMVPFFDKNWLENQLEKFNVGFNPPYLSGSKQQESMKLKWKESHDILIGGLICFELIWPELPKGTDIGLAPSYLVNTSNLGWFHGNKFGEKLMQEQFLAIGRMRAAENNTFVIIAANTGISAVISDTAPRILARSDRDGTPLPGGATLLQVGGN